MRRHYFLVAGMIALSAIGAIAGATNNYLPNQTTQMNGTEQIACANNDKAVRAVLDKIVNDKEFVNGVKTGDVDALVYVIESYRP